MEEMTNYEYSDAVSESFLNDCLQVSADGMILVDSVGEIAFANSKAYLVLELNDNDSLALSDLLNSLHVMDFVRVIHSASHDDPSSFLSRLPCGRKIEFRAVGVYSESVYQGNVVTVSDVTEQIETKNALDQFLSSMTHELRTPLAIINNCVSNLIAGVTGKLSKKTVDYLGKINSESVRLALVVNNILDMSKLETGQMSFSVILCGLKSLINTAVRELRQKIDNSDVDISVVCDDNLQIECDPVKMKQVLWNILSNALKHAEGLSRIEISVVSDSSNIYIRIKDDGPGIPNEQKRHIFSKFYQYKRKSGAGYNGLGLGLPLCQKIVESHGGSIGLDISSGLGAEFIIRLPIDEDPCQIELNATESVF